METHHNLPYCSLLQHVFDYKQGDVFGCVADIGWITGHSYIVYGPLCNGGTTVLFESTPTYPDPGDFRRYCIMQKYFCVKKENLCVAQSGCL